MFFNLYLILARSKSIYWSSIIAMSFLIISCTEYQENQNDFQENSQMALDFAMNTAIEKSSQDENSHEPQLDKNGSFAIESEITDQQNSLSDLSNDFTDGSKTDAHATDVHKLSVNQLNQIFILKAQISKTSRNEMHTLIEAGANINFQNPNGDTAIILATLAKNQEVVKYLIEAKADLLQVNEQGETVFSLLEKRGDEYNEVRKIINQKIWANSKFRLNLGYLTMPKIKLVNQYNTQHFEVFLRSNNPFIQKYYAELTIIKGHGQIKLDENSKICQLEEFQTGTPLMQCSLEYSYIPNEKNLEMIFQVNIFTEDGTLVISQISSSIFPQH